MSEFDKYHLRAQFGFEVEGNSFATMSTVQGQLKGLVSLVGKLETSASRSGNFMGTLTKGMGASVSSFKNARGAMDGASKSASKNQENLRQLAEEYRAIASEAKGIRFGGFSGGSSKTKTAGATATLKTYANQLDKIEKKLGKTSNQERILASQIKQQSAAIRDRIELFKEQQKALKAAEEKGFFNAVGAVSKQVFDKSAAMGKDFVGIYADFDDKMSAVGAVSRASAEDMDLLRKKAKQLGASTRFTSGQAAEAERMLAAAGFRAKDILVGVGDALSLASAGQLDLGASADIASNVLSGLGLKVEQLGHVTDVMALAAASANTNIQQLGTAMSYAAPPAKLFGAKIEEVSAMIGVMSDSGIQADKAGTALRSVFLRLASPPSEAAKSLQEYNIAIADSNTGKLRNVVDVLDEMSTKFKLDPKAMAQFSTFMADVEEKGGDLDTALENLPDGLHNQEKAIKALNAIFGKTAISGASAAIAGLEKVKWMSLSGAASSVEFEKALSGGLIPATAEFQQAMQNAKTNKTNFFEEFVKLVPDFKTATKAIDEAVIGVTRKDFGLKINRQKARELSSYFQTIDEFKKVDFKNLQGGEDLFNRLITSTDDAQVSLSLMRTGMQKFGIILPHQTGAAQKMAETMENNLAGSFRSLGSALEAVKLSLIEPLAPIIRAVADALTKVSLIVANLPGPIRTIIALIGATIIALSALGVTLSLVMGITSGFAQAQASVAIASRSMRSELLPFHALTTAFSEFGGTNPLETSFFDAYFSRAKQLYGLNIKPILKTATSLTALKLAFGELMATSVVPFLTAVGSALSWVAGGAVAAATSPLGSLLIAFIVLTSTLDAAIPQVSLIGKVVGTVAGAFAFAGGVVSGFIKGITSGLAEIFGMTSQIVTGPLRIYLDAFATIFEEIAKGFRSGEQLGQAFAKAILSPFKFVVTTIMNLWQVLLSRVGGVLQRFASIAALVGGQLPGLLAENSPGPTYLIRMAWEKTVNAIRGWIVGLAAPAIWLRDKLIQLLNHDTTGTIANAWSHLKDWILGIFGDISAWAGGMGKKVISAFTYPFRKAMESLTNWTAQIFSPITNAIAQVTAAIERMRQAIAPLQKEGKTIATAFGFGLERMGPKPQLDPTQQAQSKVYDSLTPETISAVKGGSVVNSGDISLNAEAIAQIEEIREQQRAYSDESQVLAQRNAESIRTSRIEVLKQLAGLLTSAKEIGIAIWKFHRNVFINVGKNLDVLGAVSLVMGSWFLNLQKVVLPAAKELGLMLEKGGASAAEAFSKMADFKSIEQYVVGLFSTTALRSIIKIIPGAIAIAIGSGAFTAMENVVVSMLQATQRGLETFQAQLESWKKALTETMNMDDVPILGQILDFSIQTIKTLVGVTKYLLDMGAVIADVSANIREFLSWLGNISVVNIFGGITLGEIASAFSTAAVMPPFWKGLAAMGANITKIMIDPLLASFKTVATAIWAVGSSIAFALSLPFSVILAGIATYISSVEQAALAAAIASATAVRATANMAIHNVGEFAERYIIPKAQSIFDKISAIIENVFTNLGPYFYRMTGWLRGLGKIGALIADQLERFIPPIAKGFKNFLQHTVVGGLRKLFSLELWKIIFEFSRNLGSLIVKTLPIGAFKLFFSSLLELGVSFKNAFVKIFTQLAPALNLPKAMKSFKAFKEEFTASGGFANVLKPAFTPLDLGNIASADGRKALVERWSAKTGKRAGLLAKASQEILEDIPILGKYATTIKALTTKFAGFTAVASFGLEVLGAWSIQLLQAYLLFKPLNEEMLTSIENFSVFGLQVGAVVAPILRVGRFIHVDLVEALAKGGFAALKFGAFLVGVIDQTIKIVGRLVNVFLTIIGVVARVIKFFVFLGLLFTPFKVLGNWLPGIVMSLRLLAAGLWVVREVLKGLLGFAQEFSEAWKTDTLLKFFLSLVPRALKALKRGFDTAFDFVYQKVTKTLSAIASAVWNFGSSIVSTAYQIARAITIAALSIPVAMFGALYMLPGMIKAVFAEIPKFLGNPKEEIRRLGDFIKKTFDDVNNYLAAKFPRIAQMIQQVRDAFANINWSSAVLAAIDNLTTAINFLNNLAGELTSWLTKPVLFFGLDTQGWLTLGKIVLGFMGLFILGLFVVQTLLKGSIVEGLSETLKVLSKITNVFGMAKDTATTFYKRNEMGMKVAGSEAIHSIRQSKVGSQVVGYGNDARGQAEAGLRGQQLQINKSMVKLQGELRKAVVEEEKRRTRELIRIMKRGSDAQREQYSKYFVEGKKNFLGMNKYVLSLQGEQEVGSKVAEELRGAGQEVSTEKDPMTRNAFSMSGKGGDRLLKALERSGINEAMGGDLSKDELAKIAATFSETDSMRLFSKIQETVATTDLNDLAKQSVQEQFVGKAIFENAVIPALGELNALFKQSAVQQQQGSGGTTYKHRPTTAPGDYSVSTNQAARIQSLATQPQSGAVMEAFRSNQALESMFKVSAGAANSMPLSSISFENIKKIFDLMVLPQIGGSPETDNLKALADTGAYKKLMELLIVKQGVGVKPSQTSGLSEDALKEAYTGISLYDPATIRAAIEGSGDIGKVRQWVETAIGSQAQTAGMKDLGQIMNVQKVRDRFAAPPASKEQHAQNVNDTIAEVIEAQYQYLLSISEFPEPQINIDQITKNQDAAASELTSLWRASKSSLENFYKVVEQSPVTANYIKKLKEEQEGKVNRQRKGLLIQIAKETGTFKKTKQGTTTNVDPIAEASEYVDIQGLATQMGALPDLVPKLIRKTAAGEATRKFPSQPTKKMNIGTFERNVPAKKSNSDLTGGGFEVWTKEAEELLLRALSTLPENQFKNYIPNIPGIEGLVHNIPGVTGINKHETDKNLSGRIAEQLLALRKDPKQANQSEAITQSLQGSMRHGGASNDTVNRVSKNPKFQEFIAFAAKAENDENAIWSKLHGMNQGDDPSDLKELRDLLATKALKGEAQFKQASQDDIDKALFQEAANLYQKKESRLKEVLRSWARSVGSLDDPAWILEELAEKHGSNIMKLTDGFRIDQLKKDKGGDMQGPLRKRFGGNEGLEKFFKEQLDADVDLKKLFDERNNGSEERSKFIKKVTTLLAQERALPGVDKNGPENPFSSFIDEMAQKSRIDNNAMFMALVEAYNSGSLPGDPGVAGKMAQQLGTITQTVDPAQIIDPNIGGGVIRGVKESRYQALSQVTGKSDLFDIAEKIGVAPQAIEKFISGQFETLSQMGDSQTKILQSLGTEAEGIEQYYSQQLLKEQKGIKATVMRGFQQMLGTPLEAIGLTTLIENRKFSNRLAQRMKGYRIAEALQMKKQAEEEAKRKAEEVKRQKGLEKALILAPKHRREKAAGGNRDENPVVPGIPSINSVVELEDYLKTQPRVAAMMQGFIESGKFQQTFSAEKLGRIDQQIGKGFKTQDLPQKINKSSKQDKAFADFASKTLRGGKPFELLFDDKKKEEDFGDLTEMGFVDEIIQSQLSAGAAFKQPGIAPEEMKKIFLDEAKANMQKFFDTSMQEMRKGEGIYNKLGEIEPEEISTFGSYLTEFIKESDAQKLLKTNNQAELGKREQVAKDKALGLLMVQRRHQQQTQQYSKLVSEHRSEKGVELSITKSGLPQEEIDKKLAAFRELAASVNNFSELSVEIGGQTVKIAEVLNEAEGTLSKKTASIFGANADLAQISRKLDADAAGLADIIDGVTSKEGIQIADGTITAAFGYTGKLEKLVQSLGLTKEEFMNLANTKGDFLEEMQVSFIMFFRQMSARVERFRNHLADNHKWLAKITSPLFKAFDFMSASFSKVGEGTKKAIAFGKSSFENLPGVKQVRSASKRQQKQKSETLPGIIQNAGLRGLDEFEIRMQDQMKRFMPDLDPEAQGKVMKSLLEGGDILGAIEKAFKPQLDKTKGTKDRNAQLEHYKKQFTDAFAASANLTEKDSAKLFAKGKEGKIAFNVKPIRSFASFLVEEIAKDSAENVKKFVQAMPVIQEFREATQQFKELKKETKGLPVLKQALMYAVGTFGIGMKFLLKSAVSPIRGFVTFADTVTFGLSSTLGKMLGGDILRGLGRPILEKVRGTVFKFTQKLTRQTEGFKKYFPQTATKMEDYLLKQSGAVQDYLSKQVTEIDKYGSVSAKIVKALKIDVLIGKTTSLLWKGLKMAGGGIALAIGAIAFKTMEWGTQAMDFASTIRQRSLTENAQIIWGKITSVWGTLERTVAGAMGDVLYTVLHAPEEISKLANTTKKALSKHQYKDSWVTQVGAQPPEEEIKNRAQSIYHRKIQEQGLPLGATLDSDQIWAEAIAELNSQAEVIRNEIASLPASVRMVMNLRDSFQATRATASQTMKELSSKVLTGMEWAFENIKSVVLDPVGAIKNFFDKAKNFDMGSWLQESSRGIADKARNIFDVVGATFNNLFDAIADRIGRNRFDSILAGITGIFTGVKGFFGKVVGAVKDWTKPTQMKEMPPDKVAKLSNFAQNNAERLRKFGETPAAPAKEASYKARGLTERDMPLSPMGQSISSSALNTDPYSAYDTFTDYPHSPINPGPAQAFKVQEVEKTTIPLFERILHTADLYSRKAASKMAIALTDAADKSAGKWDKFGLHVKNNFWQLTKDAWKSGKKILSGIAENSPGPSAVAREKWDQTAGSVAGNMEQMAGSADVAGSKIESSLTHPVQQLQQADMNAAAKTRRGGFFATLVKTSAAASRGILGVTKLSAGSVRMLGGGLMGTAAAMGGLSSVFQNTNPEIARMLEKFSQLSMVLGAVGAFINTPVLAFIALGAAAFGLYKAFEVNAFGIREKVAAMGAFVSKGLTFIKNVVVGSLQTIQNVLGVFGIHIPFFDSLVNFIDNIGFHFQGAINWIGEAWQGFVDKFWGLLYPIVQPAIQIGNMLIGALNCNPTERIPEAWEGAMDRVSNSFNWLVGPAQAIGDKISGIFNKSAKSTEAIQGKKKGGFFHGMFKLFSFKKEPPVLPVLLDFTQQMASAIAMADKAGDIASSNALKSLDTVMTAAEYASALQGEGGNYLNRAVGNANGREGMGGHALQALSGKGADEFIEDLKYSDIGLFAQKVARDFQAMRTNAGVALKEVQVEFKGRFDYLKRYGTTRLSGLFKPGTEILRGQVKLLGESFNHFGKEAWQAISNLDFKRLSTAAKVFGEDAWFAIGRIVEGFKQMSISAIALGIYTLTGLSPVALIMLGIAAAGFLVMVNFMGIRTMLSGLVKVFAGFGQVAFSTVVMIAKAFGALKRIVGGVRLAMSGDFSEMKAGWQQFKEAIATGAKGIGAGLKKSLGGVGEVLQGAFQGLRQVLFPIDFLLQKIFGSATGLGKAFNWAAKSAKDIWSALTLTRFEGAELGKTLAKSLISSFKAIPPILSQGMEWVKSNTKVLVDEILRQVDKVKIKASELIERLTSKEFWSQFNPKPMLDSFVDGFRTLPAMLSDVFARVMQGDWLAVLDIRKAFIPALEAVQAQFTTLIAHVRDAIPSFDGIRGAIAGWLQPLNGAFGIIQGFAQEIGQELAPMMEGLKGRLTSAFAGLPELMSGIITQVSPILERLSGQLSEVGQVAVERITQAWKGFVENFGVILAPVVDFATRIAQRLIGALNCNPTEKIPEAWRGAIEKVTGFFSNLLQPAVSIANKLKALFSPDQILPSLPMGGGQKLLPPAGGFEARTLSLQEFAKAMQKELGTVNPMLQELAVKLNEGAYKAGEFVGKLATIAPEMGTAADAGRSVGKILSDLIQRLVEFGQTSVRNLRGFAEASVEAGASFMKFGGSVLDSGRSVGNTLRDITLNMVEFGQKSFSQLEVFGGALTSAGAAFLRFANIILPWIPKILVGFAEVILAVKDITVSSALFVADTLQGVVKISLAIKDLIVEFSRFGIEFIANFREIQLAFGRLLVDTFEFKNQLVLAFTEIGTSIGKTTQALLSFVTEGIAAYKQLFLKIGDFGQGIQSALGQGFTGLFSGNLGIKEAFTQIRNDIGVEIERLKMSFEEFGATFKTLFTNISTSFAGIPAGIERIRTSWNQFGADVGAFGIMARTSFDQIAVAWKVTSDKLTMLKPVQRILDGLGKILVGVKHFALRIIGIATRLVSVLSGGAQQPYKGLAGIILDGDGGNVLKKAAILLHKTLLVVGSGVSALLKVIVSGGSVVEAFGTAFSKVSSTIREFASGLDGSINGAIASFEKLGSIGPGIAEKIAAKGAADRQMVKNAWNFVTGGGKAATDQVEANVTKTAQHIKNELKGLPPAAEAAGQQMVGNLTEASPGPTWQIRKNWDKTSVFMYKAMREGVFDSENAGKAIAGNYEKSFDQIKDSAKDSQQQVGAVLSQVVKQSDGKSVADPKSVKKEIPAAAQAANRMMMSLGGAMSNFAPSMATPLFMVSDFFDLFEAGQDSLQEFAKSGVTLSGVLNKFSSSIGAAATGFGGFVMSVFTGGVSLSGVFAAISVKAGVMWAALTGPLLPLTVAIGAIAGLFLIWKFNIFGIGDAVGRTFRGIGNFFGELFRIGSLIVNSVFVTLRYELRLVFQAIGRVFEGIINTFRPVAQFFNWLKWSIFGMEYGVTRVGRRSEMILINLILLPLRAVADTLKSIIRFVGQAVRALIYVATPFIQLAVTSAAIVAAVTAGAIVITKITAVVGGLAGILSAIPAALALVGAIGLPVLIGLATAVAPIAAGIGVVIGLAVMLRGVFSFIGTVAHGVMSTIFSEMARVGDALFSELGSVWHEFTKIWEILLTPIKIVLGAVGELLSAFGFAKKEGGVLTSIAGILVQGISIPIKLAANGLIVLIKVLGAVIRIIAVLGQAITHSIMAPFILLANIIKFIMGGVKNFIGAIGGFFSGVGGFFSNIFGGKKEGQSKTPAFATGGWVSGSGTSTSDSIQAQLSRDEFVVNAASARKYPQLLELINDDEFSAGLMVQPVPVPAIPAGYAPSASTKTEAAPMVMQPVFNFSFSGDIVLKGTTGPDAANEFFESLGPSLNRKVREILRDMVDKMK